MPKRYNIVRYSRDEQALNDDGVIVGFGDNNTTDLFKFKQKVKSKTGNNNNNNNNNNKNNNTKNAEIMVAFKYLSNF